MSEQNYSSYLIHYGIEGQKWGVRRFQNEDGTLTSEGREHYGYGSKRDNKKLLKQVSKVGKNATVYSNGGYSSKVSFKDYKKLAKNKAVQEAISDDKLNKAYYKQKNTEYKAKEPYWDDELYKIQSKLKKDWNSMSEEEKNKIYEKVDKNYEKAKAKFAKEDAKDPHTLAYNEYAKEVDRVTKKLVGENANKKIGDITYEQHADYIIKYAMMFKYDKIEKMLSKRR